jgi:hypothetical protein
MTELPLVLVHVLAKNKEKTLPLYLETLKEWDYPKDRIYLYIRTNNNEDATEKLLLDFVMEYGHEYKGYIFEGNDIPRPINGTKNHDWTTERLNVLRGLRDKGLRVATEIGADFYFVSDVDNYLLPHTLRTLVEANQSAIAPLLRLAIGAGETYDSEHITLAANPDNYSNFDTQVVETGDTRNGEFQHLFGQDYYDILNRKNPGIHKVAIIHCTYLLSRDTFTRVSYQNGVDGYDYIILAYNLRITRTPMYLDNREVYGCLTLAENANACSDYLERVK